MNRLSEGNLFFLCSRVIPAVHSCSRWHQDVGQPSASCRGAFGAPSRANRASTRGSLPTRIGSKAKSCLNNYGIYYKFIIAHLRAGISLMRFASCSVARLFHSHFMQRGSNNIRFSLTKFLILFQDFRQIVQSLLGLHTDFFKFKSSRWDLSLVSSELVVRQLTW